MLEERDRRMPGKRETVAMQVDPGGRSRFCLRMLCFPYKSGQGDTQDQRQPGRQEGVPEKIVKNGVEDISKGVFTPFIFSFGVLK